MAKKHTLYGARVSYFTGKARAYFDWKKIPYKEEVATRDVYKGVIVPKVGWPVIPVVVTAGGVTLQDTTEIIDYFEREDPEAPVYPKGPAQRLAALMLEVYGDEWLKIPAMHYRWNRNQPWALLEFGKLSAPTKTEAEQREIGEKIAGPFRGALPALGVHPANEAAIEKSYEALLGELDALFSVHDYCFGTKPSIGDFGLIGPLYAHQYRDPASGELMKRIAPNVAKWVERMVEPPHPREGEFLPDDTVPEALLPVLRRMMREQLPVLIKTAEAFARWASEHTSGDEIPRAIGMHDFELEGVTAQRAIFPFDLWMFQRVLDQLHSVTGDDHRAVFALLDAIGGDPLRKFPAFPRLKRKNFRLVLD